MCALKDNWRANLVIFLGIIGIFGTITTLVIISPMDAAAKSPIITNCTFYDQDYAFNFVCKLYKLCCPIKQISNTTDYYKVWYYAKADNGWYKGCVETYGMTKLANISEYLDWYEKKTFRCRFVPYKGGVLIPDDGRVDTYSVDQNTEELAYKYTLIVVCLVLGIICVMIGFSMTNADRDDTEK